jgi:hypothetical protein
VNDLPRALAPWRPELSALPLDLVHALAPLVTSIAAAIGPPRSSAAHPTGEPDGFDGLARRGSYARLLSTEWLLATEAPDEFTRRAAMGEHAFLAIGRREPRTSLALTAFFDAGPSQIGAPRIGQLALLVVLAQRARLLGATFAWGILQSRGEPFTELSQAALRAFLAARSSAEPTAEDLAPRSGGPSAGEQWLVGGARLAAMAPDARVVAIEDMDEPSVARIALRIARRGEPARDLALDLPPPRTSARLIREPFAEPARAQMETASVAGARLLFSSDGRRLLVRRPDGWLFAYPIPNSPRATRGKAARFLPPAGATVIATDWCRGRWHVVVQGGATLILHVLGKGGGQVTPPRELTSPEIALATAGQASALARLVDLGGGSLGFAIDNGSLELVGDTVRSRIARIIARRGARTLLGWGEIDGEGTPRRMLALRNDQGEDEWTYASPPCESGGDVRFGFSAQDAHPDVGLLALRTGARTWSVFTKGGVIKLDELGDFECVGLADGGALIGIDQERRALSIISRSYTRTITRAGAPIAHACVSSAAPHAAYVTEAGELVVCDIKDGAVLLHLVGEPR